VKNALMAITVVVALVVFVIFWDSPPEIFLRISEAPMAALPKASSYMLKSKTRSFGSAGTEVYSMTAQRSQFFEGQNIFELDNPVVKTHTDASKGAPWHLTANSAVVHNRGDLVVMRGNVRAWQETSTGRTELNTTKLDFFPHRDVVKTDRKVTIRSPGKWLSGTGMEADLAEGTTRLSATVKSRHYASD
jgi:LPS export ABC transporter protein LptC